MPTYELIVHSPFDAYGIGDRITDQTEVERVKREHPGKTIPVVAPPEPAKES